MSWAKMDDRYHENAKVRRAWKAHPRAVGLHSMAITHCAAMESNGYVDELWLEEKLPAKRERDAVLSALVDVGLFDVEDGKWWVHDYLDYNDSRETLQARRQRDSQRKSKQSPNGFHADSTRIPKGVHSDA